MNLAPFVVHISSSGGAAMSKALDIVRRAAYAPTRVKVLFSSWELLAVQCTRVPVRVNVGF